MTLCLRILLFGEMVPFLKICVLAGNDGQFSYLGRVQEYSEPSRVDFLASGSGLLLRFVHWKRWQSGEVCELIFGKRFFKYIRHPSKS